MKDFFFLFFFLVILKICDLQPVAYLFFLARLNHCLCPWWMYNKQDWWCTAQKHHRHLSFFFFWRGFTLHIGHNAGSLLGGQTAPQLYMHQSADQILVVVVLLFVICEVIITKCDVIYLKLYGKAHTVSAHVHLESFSLLLGRRGRGRMAFWDSNTWKVSV